MDELLTEFLAETSEILSDADEALLKLERVPDDAATLGIVFRAVHTIKGTCSFLALPKLESVANEAENLLGGVRDGKRPATPDLISTMLAYVDRIKQILAVIAQTGHEPEEDETIWLDQMDQPSPLPASVAAAPPATPTLPSIVKPAPQLAAGRSADEASPPAASPPAETSASEQGAEDPNNPAHQSIRVGLNTLETLMRLVSELVLTRNQLMQLSRSEEDSRYATPLQRLSHIVTDLQEGVMKTRMQPIQHAWSRLPRMVRDLAADLDKPIKLVMLGRDTELDRQLVELIRDPLTHMIRNSADHGLEPPDIRAAAGKPAIGTITLNSYHEGGHIIIEVSDDGAGLPIAQIREKALVHRLATAADLSTMTDNEVARFIFSPGLTTATVVTAISGRGVGMDVVRANIERVGGTIDVRSTRGVGTTFTIKIPLTLAIISALIVEAGGERFALPQLCVSELVRAEQHGSLDDGGLVVERVDGTPVLRLRDRLLPLIELRNILRLEEDAAAAKARSDAQDALTVVVVNVGRSALGLVVDQVFDTEEIVVKPVSRLLRHITMFSGNTILGDGSVIMILDPNSVARSLGASISAVTEGQAESAPLDRLERTGDRRSMLLVRVAQQNTPVAVPLGLVARIESIAFTDIERSSGRSVTSYREQLMPLIELCSTPRPGQTHAPVLVFTDRGRSMGLIVDEIVDVVEDELVIELAASRPGVLGTALIAGEVTDVLDAGHWLLQSWNDWFRDGARASDGDSRARLLVVEDSAFFRHLIVPTLSAAGYHVTAVESASLALGLLDRADGPKFDMIISDVEMPEMDGLSLAQSIKAADRWKDVPLVALSGNFHAADITRGQAAGFDDYVAKFDRNNLLNAIERQLSQPARKAA